MKKLTIAQEQAAAYILCYYIYKFPGQQGTHYKAAVDIQNHLEQEHDIDAAGRKQVMLMGNFLTLEGFIPGTWVRQFAAEEQEL